MSTAGGAWVRAVLFHQLSDSYLPRERGGVGVGVGSTRSNKVICLCRSLGNTVEWREDGEGGGGGDSTGREREGGEEGVNGHPLRSHCVVTTSFLGHTES